jgi:hypothetical protein
VGTNRTCLANAKQRLGKQPLLAFAKHVWLVPTDESATHILRDCEAIVYLRFSHLGQFFMEPSEYYLYTKSWISFKV